MDCNVTNGFFTLFGALMGGMITYFPAKAIVQKQARVTAYTRLYAAFAPEMAVMREMQAGSGDEVPIGVINRLWERMPEYWRAVEEFRFYVPDKKKKAYDEALDEFWRHGGTAYYKKSEISLFFARLDKLFAFVK